MQILKTVLKYIFFGFVLFMITGMLFGMIKNSDSQQTSKKIFMK